ncbi:ankyrin repeat and SOCS box protein 11-like isoform X2 [Branchiostoma floridae]|uniref:Ankyrin repeat and SOCS box protein 11-like isoform X2 n=1 Tax=Branchiostoma floridae TaxID=7739 RepID=A0A9J7LJM5_BRAFL|nr:ankyrin repeat and SOCS box protein 11-like isoform X2 [Branchiostoma floridae]
MEETVNESLLAGAESDSLEGIEAALAAGADIDFNQLENWSPGEDASLTPCTPLYVACLRGNVDVVKLLLRKGASVGKRALGASVPLHAAASNEIVELLVHHGATVDIQDPFKNTPLMVACYRNHVDTVRRLIEFGARPDLTQKLGIEDENRDFAEESVKLVREARNSKLLRCCNPKCGKPGYRKTLKRCSQCKLTRYCSRDCQIQHWSVGHKKCCGQDKYIDEEPHPMEKAVVYLVENDKQNDCHYCVNHTCSRSIDGTAPTINTRCIIYLLTIGERTFRQVYKFFEKCSSRIGYNNTLQFASIGPTLLVVYLLQ